MSDAPSDSDTIAAIHVVQRHLDANWISDACREEPCLGCVSCAAHELHIKLKALANALSMNRSDGDDE